MYNSNITAPTVITPAEYANATYAIDRENNIWILWGEGKHLWLGYDKNEWKNTQEVAGHDNCEVVEITVTNDSGWPIDVEALTCPISMCASRLDLDALAQGNIEWI